MEHSLKILRTEAEIGLGPEFRFLHITDTHIPLDDPGKETDRYRCFENDFPNCPAEYFYMACRYAAENGLLMLNTGDFFDFLSERNFAFADRYLLPTDTIYAAGNHDFCHCVGAAKEDEPYKWEMIGRSAPHLPNNLYFYSRIVDGVNFVTLDNSYYRMTDGQIDLLRAEAARGYPIVLGIHCPLFHRAQADRILANGNPCAYLMGAPREYLEKYPPDRREQQAPDAATERAMAYLLHEPAIRLIVAGHTHINFEETLENGTPQLTTAGSFDGYVREVVLH